MYLSARLYVCTFQNNAVTGRFEGQPDATEPTHERINIRMTDSARRLDRTRMVLEVETVMIRDATINYTAATAIQGPVVFSNSASSVPSRVKFTFPPQEMQRHAKNVDRTSLLRSLRNTGFWHSWNARLSLIEASYFFRMYESRRFDRRSFSVGRLNAQQLGSIFW